MSRLARHATVPGYASRPLRGGGTSRRRRHGRGVPGPRFAAQPGRRGQGRRLGSRRRPRAPPSVRGRGSSGGGPQPPERAVGLRHRPARGLAVRGLRAPGGRDPAPASQSGAASMAQGRRDRRAGVPGAGGRPRPGHRAPGPQAGEPVPHPGRSGEDPGLRPRQAQREPGRGRGRSRDPRRDRAGVTAGDARLHVSGAGSGRAGRRAVGHLRPRGDALRDALGAFCLRAAHARRDGERDPRPRPRPDRLLLDERPGAAGARAARAPLPGEGAGGALPVGSRPRLRHERARRQHPRSHGEVEARSVGSRGGSPGGGCRRGDVSPPPSRGPAPARDDRGAAHGLPGPGGGPHVLPGRQPGRVCLVTRGAGRPLRPLREGAREREAAPPHDASRGVDQPRLVAGRTQHRLRAAWRGKGTGCISSPPSAARNACSPPSPSTTVSRRP